MPHTSGSTRQGRLRLTLNSDGLPHTRENTLSVVAVVCGLVAFAAAFVPAAHVLASWAGALGFGVGLYAQYVSATTPERALNIVGIVASFVGVAIGIYHGGFLP